MTDLSSFNGSDITYSADIKALNNLANSKCSEAGVTGTGLNNAYLDVGDIIYASHINQIINAYRRAWDASSNAPGTKQSAVSQNALIDNAVYYHMWYQLNDMEFGLPVVESGASTTIYVIEPANGLLGTGGNLSTTNRTLQDHGVASVSDGYRVYPANTYLYSYTARVANALEGASKWCYLTQLKINSSFSSGRMVATSFSIRNNLGKPLSINYTCGTAYGGILYSMINYMPNRDPCQTYTNIDTGRYWPVGQDLWLAVWYDGTSVKMGWKTGAKPKAWGDFLSANRRDSGCNPGVLNNLDFTTSDNIHVASASGTGCSVGVKSYTLAKNVDITGS